MVGARVKVHFFWSSGQKKEPATRTPASLFVALLSALSMCRWLRQVQLPGADAVRRDVHDAVRLVDLRYGTVVVGRPGFAVVHPVFGPTRWITPKSVLA